MRALVCLVVVTTAGGALPLHGQEPATPVPLRWKFRQGEAFRYQFRQKSTIQSRDPARALSVVNELAVDFLWTVDAVNEDGSVVLKQKIEAAKASLEGGDTKLRYDSKGGGTSEPNALSRLYEPALAGESRVTIEPRGRILEVVVPEKLTEVLKGSPFQATADGGSVFSAAGWKGLLGQHIPLFPEVALNPGGGWEQNLAIPRGLSDMVLRFRYTLKSIDSRAAAWDVAISYEVAPAKGVELTVKLDEGKGAGSSVFDLEAGRLKSSQLHQELKPTLVIGDQSYPQSVLIDATMTLVP